MTFGAGPQLLRNSRRPGSIGPGTQVAAGGRAPRGSRESVSVSGRLYHGQWHGRQAGLPVLGGRSGGAPGSDRNAKDT